MAYESVKNQIDAYIKANGVNLITGPVLNAVLTTMLDDLGEGYAFQGVLNTTDTPSPAADIPQAWLASAGSYLGGSITVDEGELALIIHTADGWSKETVYRGVQLSYEAIVAALEYTPASEYRVESLESYVDENYQPKLESGTNIKTINNQSLIGSGNIDTVQPVDIEDMVEAEPIGSIIPPVNPSEFATKEEVSQLGQEVDDIDTAVQGAIQHSKNLADFAETADGYYVNSSGAYYQGTGEKSIVFPCAPSTTYTISKILTSRFRVVYFDHKPENTDIGGGVITNNDGTSITITTAADSVYIVAFIYNGSSESVTWAEVLASLQIEIGATATVYVAPGWIAIDRNAREDIEKLADEIAEIPKTPAIPLKAVDYGYKDPVVMSGADVLDLTKWEVGNGATLATGTAYNNITRINRRVMTITSDSGNGRAWCNLATPANSNTCALLVEFRINYSGNTVPGFVVIELWSGTTRTNEYKRSIQFQLYNATTNRNGWHQACFFLSSAKSFWVDGVNFDATAVTAVGFQLHNSTNVGYSVSVARMDFVPAMQKPGILTIVDNFGVSVPAMADYAYSKGVRLNLSIIPGAYTNAPGVPTCATRAELDRIAAQGHCIWNHTYTHQVLNNLTFAQIQDQINLAEQWMEENGYGKNCDFLSIPSAIFNTEASDAVFESNVRTIFHNWCYNHQMVYAPYGPVMRTLPVTLLDSVALSEGKTPADIASVAAKCVTYNGLAVIGFHGTYWELDNGESWKAYIDAIAELGVYHYGIDELIAGRWC